MLVSGINPGIPIRENQEHEHPDLKKARLNQELKATEKEMAVKKERSETEEKEARDKEEDQANAEKFLISEYQLKELLFIAASRGNSASIEKMIEVLKKQKDSVKNA